MVTVALDGRGVEKGPDVLAEGARLAMADGIQLRVFGDPGELSQLSAAGAEVIDAPGSITNEDDPVASVRSREDASIVMAAADVAEGSSQALVSAGPTGATMTAALFAFRRLSGVRRPSLAVQLPNVGHDGPPTLLLDAGANSEARSQDLVQSGVMGAAFSRAVLGVEDPRVALLSVGEESKKGTAEVVEAHAELAGLNGIRLHRQHRRPRPALGSGGRHRDRRIHRERGAEDARGDREDGRLGGRRSGSVESRLGRGWPDASARAGRPAPEDGPGHDRRRDSPRGCAASPSWGTGARAPDGIANAIRLAARAVSERSTERTADLLASAGATRASLK